MVSYEEVLKYLQVGEVITYKQYKLDLHEKRKLIFSAQNVLINAIIYPNQTLSHSQLIEYYGDNLSEVEYLQLATMNCIRFVISIGLQDNKVLYKVIVFNKDFYNTGLQEISFFNQNIDTKFVPFIKGNRSIIRKAIKLS